MSRNVMPARILPDAAPDSANLVAALSAAVDLSMGRRPGHARAAAAYAARLAENLGVSDRQIREITLAALLKDAG